MKTKIAYALETTRYVLPVNDARLPIFWMKKVAMREAKRFGRNINVIKVKILDIELEKLGGRFSNFISKEELKKKVEEHLISHHDCEAKGSDCKILDQILDLLK